ncbi:MAG: SLC13 family permease [Acidobacteriota bacterium]
MTMLISHVSLSALLLPAIVALSLLLMLLRPLRVAEAWWVAGGALLLIALRQTSVKAALHAVAQGTDVSLFLIGMMLLAELARDHGVFGWLSSLAMQDARGSCSRLFGTVTLVGVLVTALLSNDATAVVLTPAILAVVRKARLSPLPYLFLCALMANAASFVLPISNPANLVVFHAGMPPLALWLRLFAVPSLAAIGMTFAVLRVIFRRELRGAIQDEVERVTLSAGGRLVLWGLGLVILVLLAASALRMELGLPTLLAGLAITAAASLYERRDPRPLLREVSWSIILLVAGLFVLVNAVETHGALKLMQSWLVEAQRLPDGTAAMAVGLALGVFNNLVNNLPLGLIAGGAVQAAHVHGLMAQAAMLGIDLGPNLSVTGSLATILWLAALRKEGIEMSGWKFLKVGMVAMPLALAAALGSAVVMAGR